MIRHFSRAISVAILISAALSSVGASANPAGRYYWLVFHPGRSFSSFYGVATASGRSIWVSDNEGRAVYRITRDGKRATGFPIDAFRPEEMIVGPGADVYTNSLSSSGIAIVTPLGSYGIFHTLDLPAGGLAVGSDGNVWFTEQQHIGKITPHGKITEYLFPPGGLAATGIAAGPDGKLWFGANPPGVGVIGNIDPVTGNFHTYSLNRDQWCYPNSILSAPDGNLWFTCQQDGIGRISTRGAYELFRLPGFGFSGPGSFVVGPDGALWFAGGTPGPTASIGRFDLVTHDVVTYRAPTGVRSLLSIVFDNDGNIWGCNLSGQVVVFVRTTL